MTDTNSYQAPRTRSSQTTSFGAHRDADRPASALRAGASSMPAAWQPRTQTPRERPNQHGAPVRNFADVMLDPVRWATSTPARKAGLGVVLAGCAVIAIF